MTQGIDGYRLPYDGQLHQDTSPTLRSMEAAPAEGAAAARADARHEPTNEAPSFADDDRTIHEVPRTLWSATRDAVKTLVRAMSGGPP